MTNFKLLSSTIKSVVEKRSTIKSLGWAIIDAGKDSIAVTDLDILATIYPAGITGNGKIAVNAHSLAKIAASCKKHMSMTVLDGALVVVADGDTYTLDSEGDIKNFPSAIELGKNEGSIMLPMSAFSVVFAASTEQTRYYLCGVYLTGGKTVTTDGHRLALKDSGRASTIKEGIIIPSKTIYAMQHIYGTQEVSISYHGSRIVVNGAGVTIVSKLIDGNFPDYNRVMPNMGAVTVRADIKTKDMLAVLAKKSVVDSKRVDLYFSAQGCRAVLKGDKLKLERSISSQALPELAIGANASYMADLMAQMDGCFTLSVIDASSPMHLQGCDKSAQYVLMPMRF